MAATDRIPADWDQISALARQELAHEPVCELHPAMNLQTSADGRQFKFRKYARAEEALEKKRILDAIKGTLPVAPLVGWDACLLCFAYVPVAVETESKAFCQAIGEWMGRLAVNTMEWDTAARIDAAAATWLDDLEQAGFFSRAVVNRARAKYRHLRPERMTVCVNYWDAMPWNFSQMDGKTLLLDEKHLRPGPTGIGLVKPSLFLTGDEFDALYKGYASTASNQLVDPFDPFLEFMYRTYALDFYLHGMRIGATSYDGNPRLRRFRETYLDAVEPTAVERRRDRRQFIVRYPRQNARYFFKRVERWRRRRLKGID